MDDHQLGPGGGSPTKRVKRDTTETAGTAKSLEATSDKQHNPPGPEGQTSDPEKRKLIQQQLVLLLHARKCKKREEVARGEYRPCTLPHCRTMKGVLNHMTECQAGRECKYPHCASSRQIISHWKNCQRSDCPVCLPLKHSSVHPPAQQRESSSKTAGGVNPREGVMDPSQSGTPPRTSPKETGRGNIPASIPADSEQSQVLYPIPIPPITSPLTQLWQQHVNPDVRQHLMRKLVEAIYPVQDPLALQDRRVASVIQYAMKVEKAMFETATSREEYYQLLAEKIYRIRKELEERRKAKNEMDERTRMRVPPVGEQQPSYGIGGPPLSSQLSGGPKLAQTGTASSSSSFPLPPTPSSSVDSDRKTDEVNMPQVKIEDLVIKSTQDTQLGSGSFGEVWKGTQSGSPCAVKVLHGVSLFLPLHGSVTSERQKRFESECKFLEQLKHRNIVRYLQRYIHPGSGTTMLAMELMDENLSTFLTRQRRTHGERLGKCIQMKLSKDVAQALDYLHSIPVVHRDLSSNNILLSTQTVNCRSICAKVSDFGISRLIDNERFDKTLSTLAPGTKGYMPPESWISHSKYNEKFDIFSYGVLVVQIITTLPPSPSDRIDNSNKVVPEVKRREDHLFQM